MRKLLFLMMILFWVLPVTAQEPEDLTESYEVGIFSMRYPADWYLLTDPDESDMLYYSNMDITFEEAQAFDTVEEHLEPGAIIGGVLLPNYTQWMITNDDPDKLADLIATFCGNDPVICTAPEALTWHGDDSILFRITVKGSTMGGTGMVGQIGEDVIVMITVGDQATIEAVEPTLIVMFQSIEYGIPVIAPDPAFADLKFSETYEQGGTTFGYAADWAVTAHSVDEIPVIASNPARLTRDQSAMLAEDEFLLRVYPPEYLRTLTIDPHLAPAETLQHMLELNPERAGSIESIRIGDFAAARIHRPQREFMETFYAVRISESCMVVFALMTNPASTDHFAGLLPYWLETVSCQ